MQRAALALALAIALTATPTLAQNGPEASAEARLEAAKNAMVDHALSQPTRVHSAAWIDENGVLHEQNRFQATGQIRGIRMPSYLPPAPEGVDEEEPTNPLPTEASETLQGLQALGEAGSCPSLPGLAHMAVLQLENHTPQGSGAEGYARQLEAETRRLLLRRFEGAPGWRLAPRHEATSLSTDYERAVYEGPRNRRPLQLTLALSVRQGSQKPRWWNLPAKALAPMKENFGPFRQSPRALELDLELRLSTPEDPAYLWVGYDSLRLGARSSQWSPAVLPRDVGKIYARLNQWFEALEERQSCEAPRYAVSSMVRGQYVISGGRQAGLKPGDKLILADGLRTPEDVLAQGVDGSMALAEVRWIEEEEAGLTLLSGAAPKSPAQLVAIPL
jgi:hypothetical protein